MILIILSNEFVIKYNFYSGSVPAAVNSLPKVQISTVNDQSCELSSVVHENEDNSVTNYSSLFI